MPHELVQSIHCSEVPNNIYQSYLKNIDNFLYRADVVQLNDLFCEVVAYHHEEEDLPFIKSFFNMSVHIGCHLHEENEIIFSLEFINKLSDIKEIYQLFKKRQGLYQETKDVIKNFLESLVGWNEVNANQNIFDEKTSNFTHYIAQKTLTLLRNLPAELINNKKICSIIEDIKSVNHGEKNNLIILLNNLQYCGLMNAQTEKKLATTVDLVINAPNRADIKLNIVSDLTKSLLNNDKELFMRSVEEYISIYQITHEKNGSITENDIIELFFSFYFCDFSSSHDNFMEFLIDYYQEDIFFSFMEKYNIDYNIPLLFLDEDEDEDKILPKYFSLFEYACDYEKRLMKAMIDRKIDVLKSFSREIVIENKIYHYKAQPFDSLDAIYTNLLIKNGLIDYKTEVGQYNIFYFLLKELNYVSFIYLYEQSKSLEEFSLYDISTNHPVNMLYFYLENKKDNVIHDCIINILVEELKEHIVLEQDFTSYLGDNEIYNINFIKLLEPLFAPQMKEQKSLKITQDTTSEKLEETKIQWFDKLTLSKVISQSTGNNVNFLNKLLNNIADKKPILKVKDETFFEQLEYNIPNFKEVIDYYKGAFRQNFFSNKKRISPILLLGNPGIGKTYFAKTLASHLKTGYQFIDMGSLTSSWILTGNNGTWQDAKQGKIVDTMIASPTFNPIVLLDELDKNVGGKYDSTTALYQLLEEVNASNFTDEYLDMSFDVSGIIYIACVNSLHTLSEPLLSRFEVFKIPDPTETQLRIIVQNMYRENIAINPLMATLLDEDLFDLLKPYSLRKIKGYLEKATNHLLLQYSHEQLQTMVINKEKLSLKAEHFKMNNHATSIGF